MSAGVLVVEDERLIAKNIRRFLDKSGFDVRSSESGREALSEFERFRPDAVLLDFRLPDLDGLEVLRRLHLSDPEAKVVMMSAVGTTAVAVKAMKAGAVDYLSKPLVLGDLKNTLERVVGQPRHVTAPDVTAPDVPLPASANCNKRASLLGQSQTMATLKMKIDQIVRSESALGGSALPSVLITGETGSGKQLVAQAIHAEGSRRKGPFVELNCAAIPSHLIESELFGYERGAFTDARQRKLGLVEAAHGGTLFLDEIGEIELAVQSKLLKLLEDRSVRRLGGLQDRAMDVRIIAATNQPLEQRVMEGSFRRDLFYRLRVLQIRVPPLRDRPDDILLLANHFLELQGARIGKPGLRFNKAAKAAMQQHIWPGNVREIRNVVEQAVFFAQEPEIGSELLGLDPVAGEQSGQGRSKISALQIELPEGGLNFEELEQKIIVQAMEQSGGNMAKAAKLLGLSYETLRYRIEKFGLRQTS